MSETSPILREFSDANRIAAEALAHIHHIANNPKHPARWPTVGTRTLAGDMALRVVVLRGVDQYAGTLSFTTDVRSPKVAQLQAHLVAEWCLYDPTASIQFVISTSIKVHHQDELARREWELQSPHSRSSYAESDTPSSIIADDVPVTPAQSIEVDRDEVYEHFALVVGTIKTLEILILSREGNRRAKLIRNAGAWDIVRLVP